MQTKQNNIFLKMLPLFFVLFIDSMGQGLIFPILVDIIQNTNSGFLSKTTTSASREIIYSVIIGVYMVCWFFGAAILGDLSDKIGRKKSLVICLIGTGLGYLLSAVAILSKSLSLFIIGRIIDGFTSGSQPIAQAAIVDESDKSSLPKNMSLMLLFITLGFVFGPLIGGVLSDKNIFYKFRFYTPLYFASILSLINIILLCWLVKNKTPHKKNVSIKIYHALNIFISAFKHRKIRIMSLYFLIMLIGWTGYYVYISNYARQKYDLSPFEVSMFMGALGLGFAIGAGFMANIFNKYLKLKNSVAIGLLLSGFLMMMYNFISTDIQLLAWINNILIGIFGLVAWSNLMVLFSHQVGETEQGWVMGVTGSIMAFAFAMVSFFMGSLINHFGISFPIISGSCWMILSGVLFLISKFK